MVSKYPNQWYVEVADPRGEFWLGLIGSVGNKSFAEGYFSATQAYNPRPAYRLIDKNGNIVRTSEARSGVHLN